MLTKILLSSTWQQINLKVNYKNNNNVPIIIQSTEYNVAPTVETGLVIPAYQSFKIPADGLYYWVKMANGAGEMIVDPTYIVPNITGGSGTIHEQGTAAFAGSTSFTEVVLSVDPGVDFQAIITPLGDDGSSIGAVTVVYHEAGKFKVYNTGSATTDFEWLVLVNS